MSHVDSFAWKNSSDGTFSTKSAYLAVKKQNPIRIDCDFDLCWSWPGPERIKLFLWKALHKILMTNDERGKRHITDCRLCPICGGFDETLLHVFRDCNRIQLLWSCIVLPNHFQFFRSNNWNRWLELNLSKNQTIQDKNWRVLFGFTLDSIWRARNDTIFSGTSTSFNAILSRAEMQMQSAATGKATAMALTPIFRTTLTNPSSGWTPNLHVPVTLNVDAAVRNWGSMAGCGGVFRSNDGDFLGAFTKPLTGCTVAEAELQAILEGLKIAKEKGWDRIGIQSDSQVAINSIVDGPATSTCFSLIIDCIRELVNECTLVSWSKIPRDQNVVADALAKSSLSTSCFCLLFDSAPLFIHPFLRMDKDGLANL